MRVVGGGKIEFQCDLCLCNLVLPEKEVGKKKGKGIKCSRCGHLHSRRRASEICGYDPKSDDRPDEFREDFPRRQEPKRRPTREQLRQSKRVEQEEILPVYVASKRPNEGGFVLALSMVGLVMFFVPLVSLIALVMAVRQWLGIMQGTVSSKRSGALFIGCMFSVLGLGLGTWYLGSLVTRPPAPDHAQHEGADSNSFFSQDWWLSE